MKNRSLLRFASFLYRYFFPLYKTLYYRFKKTQDASEIRLLKRLIRKGDTILDIGSNIGFYTEIIARITGPEGKVHCFEPDRVNFGHLKKNTQSLANVFRNECAVSDEAGTITLYVSNMLNVDHRTYKPESFSSSYAVKKISVDDYVNGSFHVDFIKMDIQGAELKALKGMQKTIGANPGIKILMEFWPYGIHKSGSSIPEVLGLIQSPGLKAYRVEKDGLKEIPATTHTFPETGEFQYFDVLICRNYEEKEAG